ncbi:MAG: hypothetical protein M1833_003950 [Piccolia ochrophora]|nr:MAG: hypothetical protein M1833_003950 [Piccolia ochrophora]
MSGNDEAYQQPQEGLGDEPIQDTTNDYKGSASQDEGFVLKDEASVADPVNPDTADSDEALARDDNDAIDKSNIIGERTRGATAGKGYSEPDEDDIPEV